MPNSATKSTVPVRRPVLLMVEPDFMVRRTIVLTARDLNIADIHETSGSDAALPLLEQAHFDGILICIDEAGLDLIAEVRGGHTHCNARTPMAVTMNTCSAAEVTRLRQLDVDNVLLRPFKLKALLQALQTLTSTSDADKAV